MCIAFFSSGHSISYASLHVSQYQYTDFIYHTWPKVTVHVPLPHAFFLCASHQSHMCKDDKYNSAETALDTYSYNVSCQLWQYSICYYIPNNY